MCNCMFKLERVQMGGDSMITNLEHYFPNFQATFTINLSRENIPLIIEILH